MRPMPQQPQMPQQVPGMQPMQPMQQMQQMVAPPHVQPPPYVARDPAHGIRESLILFDFFLQFAPILTFFTICTNIDVLLITERIVL